MPWYSLCVGINVSGDSGRGSRPMAYLMEISKAETGLRKTSFVGSLNCLLARVESSGASVIIHKNVHVSRRILISLHHKRRPLFQGVKVQKIQEEPVTCPLLNL